MRLVQFWNLFRIFLRIFIILGLVLSMLLLLIYSCNVLYYMTDGASFYAQDKFKYLAQYYILLVLKYLYHFDFLKDLLKYVFSSLNFDLVLFDELIKNFRKPMPFIYKEDLKLFKLIFPDVYAFDVVFLYIIYLTGFYVLNICFKFIRFVDKKLKKSFIILTKLDKISKIIVNIIHFLFIILGIINAIYNPMTFHHWFNTDYTKIWFFIILKVIFLYMLLYITIFIIGFWLVYIIIYKLLFIKVYMYFYNLFLSVLLILFRLSLCGTIGEVEQEREYLEYLDSLKKNKK